MTRSLLATLTALCLAACGTTGSRPHLPPREPQPGPNTGEFGRVRDEATRRDRLYDGIAHRGDVSGLWLSPEVRDAATRRLAEWQGWSETELTQALARDRAEAARGEEFLLALYTADRKHNDLDARSSIWRIELDDFKTQAVATSAEAVTVDATLGQLYPFIGPFDTVYRVRVRWTGEPLAGRRFALRLASALGTLELDFGPAGRRAARPWLP